MICHSPIILDNPPPPTQTSLGFLHTREGAIILAKLLGQGQEAKT